MSKKLEDKFTEEETRRRMEAALRGARVAGHKAKPAPKRDPGKAAKQTKADKKPGG